MPRFTDEEKALQLEFYRTQVIDRLLQPKFEPVIKATSRPRLNIVSIKKKLEDGLYDGPKEFRADMVQFFKEAEAKTAGEHRRIAAKEIKRLYNILKNEATKKQWLSDQYEQSASPSNQHRSPVKDEFANGARDVQTAQGGRTNNSVQEKSTLIHPDKVSPTMPTMAKSTKPTVPRVSQGESVQESTFRTGRYNRRVCAPGPAQVPTTPRYKRGDRVFKKKSKERFNITGCRYDEMEKAWRYMLFNKATMAEGDYHTTLEENIMKPEYEVGQEYFARDSSEGLKCKVKAISVEDDQLNYEIVETREVVYDASEMVGRFQRGVTKIEK